METPKQVPSTPPPQEGLSQLAASTFLSAVVSIAVPVTMSLLTQPPAQSAFSQAPTSPVVHDKRFISQLDS